MGFIYGFAGSQDPINDTLIYLHSKQLREID